MGVTLCSATQKLQMPTFSNQRSNALDSANLAPAASGSGRPHTDLRAQGLSTHCLCGSQRDTEHQDCHSLSTLRGIWNAAESEFWLQTGYKTYCFTRKGILGTAEMNGSCGSKEKFISFTQSKGHGNGIHSFASLHGAQMCRTDNTFLHSLGSQPITKLQICRARELPWTWKRSPGNQPQRTGQHPRNQTVPADSNNRTAAEPPALLQI